MYSDKVIEHFQHPRNVGEIENADGVGKVGNPVCGDIMLLTIKVGENKRGEKIIENIKFKTMGCAAAISSSSMLTELVKGKTFKESLRVSKKDIVSSLGGLPEIKLHCSVLATEALNEAIYDCLSRNKLAIPKEVQKRHERIHEELKRMEKQYREFVRAQEKILRK